MFQFQMIFKNRMFLSGFQMIDVRFSDCSRKPDHFKTELQWGSKIRPFEIWEHLKSGIFEGWISNGPFFKWLGFSYGYSYSPNHLKTGPFQIRTFLSGFQMVFDLMAGICPDFNWLGFWISESIRNPDHLKPNLFMTIQNPD